MKKNVNLIKKFVIVLLATVLLMYILTGRSLADDIINLDSLETIESVDSTTNNNADTDEVEEISVVTTDKSTNNIVKNEVTTNSQANKKALPDTGSNAEIIFIIGTTVLAGTAIYLYNKTKIK